MTVVIDGNSGITTPTSVFTDSSGNVGIGQANPSNPLHIYAASAPQVRIQDANGSFYIGRDSSSNALLNMNQAYAMIFQTSGTERARITSGGAFLIGQTSQANSEQFGVLSSNAGAAVYGKNTSSGGFSAQFSNGNATGNNQVIYAQWDAQAPNNATAGFLYCSDTAALRAQIRSNGGIANFSANNVNISDRREKTNFAPAKNYLDVICAIPVQTFNYIDQNLEEDAGLTLGVVAQDVQAVAPEMVMESNWGTEEEPKMRLSIYQTDLQYALMKSIQELKAIVDAQAAEIAALKGTT